MRKRVVAIVLVVAMLLTGVTALAKEHVVRSSGLFVGGDLVNTDFRDINVKVVPGVDPHIIGNIITNVTSYEVKPPFGIYPATLLMEDGSAGNSSLLLDGNIRMHYENVPLHFYLYDALVNANNNDLVINGDITLQHITNDRSNIVMVNTRADSNTSKLGGKRRFEAKNIIGDTAVSGDHTSDLTGISAYTTPTGNGLDIYVMEDILLNTIAKGDTAVTGIDLMSMDHSELKKSTLDVGGDLVANAASMDDGMANAYGFTLFGNLKEADNAFLGELEANFGGDIKVNAGANEAAKASAIIIKTSDDAGDGSVTLDFGEDISAVANSNNRSAYAEGINIEGGAVQLNGPSVGLISALASGASSSVEAYGVVISGQSGLSGNPFIEASAFGRSALAHGVEAKNGAALDVNNIDVTVDGDDYAYAYGIDAEYSDKINAGKITVNASGYDPIVFGISAKGSPVDAQDIVITARAEDTSPLAMIYPVFGVRASEGSIVNAGDVNIDSTGKTVEAVSAEGKDTEVTVKNIFVKGANDVLTPYVVSEKGAQVTAEDVTVPGGATALKVDNVSKIKVNGLLSTDTEGDRSSNARNEAAIIHMYVDNVAPVSGNGVDIDTAVVTGGKLVYVGSSGAIMSEEDLIDHMSEIHIKNLLSMESLPDLIDGAVKDKELSGDAKGKILQDKLTVDNPYLLFGWEDGDHYTIDKVDTSKLIKIDDYDLYAGKVGEDVSFHVEPDFGYSIRSVDAGGYTEAVAADGDNWYYVKVPVGNGVYITVKVSKNVYSAIWKPYFYGLHPETKELQYWICTKVDNGEAKLISVNGYEKTPEDFVEEYFSAEEKENLKSDGYYLDPELSEEMFEDGLEHPIIDVDVFYIGY